MKTLPIVLALAVVLSASSAARAFTPPPMQQPDQPPMQGPPPMAPMPSTTEAPPYVDAACGSWQGDTWTSNGHCSASNYRHQTIAGTVAGVKGHSVTLNQTSAPTVVIDVSQAPSDQLAGSVAVGRQIVAHGYWQGRTFYATAIAGSPPP